jgi:hypothetical protein
MCQRRTSPKRDSIAMKKSIPYAIHSIATSVGLAWRGREKT